MAVAEHGSLADLRTMHIRNKDAMDWTPTTDYLELGRPKAFCDSGFGRLPGELRNRIYDLVVPSGARREVIADAAACAQPVLSRVCHQLRAEILPIYYIENTFAMKIYMCDTDAATKWLRCLGSENAMHLRKVRVELNRLWDYPDNLRKLAKELSASGVCRDAVSWWVKESRLDWDHRDSDEPQQPHLVNSRLTSAGYPSTYGHHLQSALPCRICRGEQREGNSEEHVLGGGPRWIGDDAPSSLRQKYLTQVLSANGDLEHILATVGFDSAVVAMEELEEETGMELAYCRECLIATGWNLDKAVVRYSEMNDRLPSEAWVWTLRGLA